MTAHRLAPDEDGYVYRRSLPGSDPDPIRCEKCGRECEDDGYEVPGNGFRCRPCVVDLAYDLACNFAEELFPRGHRSEFIAWLADEAVARLYKKTQDGKYIARFK